MTLHSPTVAAILSSAAARRTAAVALWNSGSSYGVIAAELRISRCAVAGLIRRAKEHGAEVRAGVGTVQRQSKPKPPKGPKPAKDHKPVAATKAPVSRPAPRPAVLDFGPMDPKPLLQARALTCRAVVGTTEDGAALYCCRPKAHDVFWYCGEHIRRVVQPGTARRVGDGGLS